MLVEHRESITAALGLAAVALFITACFAPGRMNFDTVFQLNEVASGDFTNQHATVLEALWKPSMTPGSGPAQCCSHRFSASSRAAI